jgi:hypothetical protein
MTPPLSWLDPDIAAGIEVALLGIIPGFDYHASSRAGRTSLRVAFRVDADRLTLRYEARRPATPPVVRFVDLRAIPWHAMVLRLAAEERELWRAYRLARAEATAYRALDATRRATTRAVAVRHAERAARAAARAVLLAHGADAGQACAYANEAHALARYRV